MNSLVVPAWIHREIAHRLMGGMKALAEVTREVPSAAHGIERQYAEYKRSISGVRLIAGSSYDALNRRAAWTAVRVSSARLR